jgi:hypothetical protein
MNNWCICWFFTNIFTGDFNFKGLTVRRLYKSFGVKGLTRDVCKSCHVLNWIIFKFIFRSKHTFTKFKNFYWIHFRGYTNPLPASKEIEALQVTTNPYVVLKLRINRDISPHTHVLISYTGSALT